MTNQPNPNNPYIQNNSTNTQQNADKQNTGILNVFADQNTQKDYIKGALIGAVANFILTNENAKRTIFKGFAKVSGLFEAGIEELKERYEDAKAEVNSQE